MLGQGFGIAVNTLLFISISTIPIFLLILKLVTDFWEKPVSEWGVETWNSYYNKKNTTTSQSSLSSFCAELDVLINHGDRRTKAWKKAKSLRNESRVNPCVLRPASAVWGRRVFGLVLAIHHHTCTFLGCATPCFCGAGKKIVWSPVSFTLTVTCTSCL